MYMSNSYIVYLVKMKYAPKPTSFGLKMVESGQQNLY